MNLNKSYTIDYNGTSKNLKEVANNFAVYEGKGDVAIWKDFKTGNSDVLIYMYHNYVAQLLRFGIQFAPREAVKDSIQDLFLYLKERKNHTNEVRNISAYLYKCLYRIIKKKVDYSKNLSSINVNTSLKNWRVVISKEIKLIEQEEQTEQTEKLQYSLEKLSIKQRQVILLYYYEGFTHQEIADILELKNKSSVRKLIYRALDILKENLLE